MIHDKNKLINFIIVNAVAMILCACGGPFASRRARVEVPNTAVALTSGGLRQSQPPGYEIQRPSDKPIFTEVARSAYLKRVDDALAKVRKTCAGRCDQTVSGSDGKNTRVVIFPAGTFALDAKDCIKFGDGGGYADTILLEGAGQGLTSLDYSAAGIAACGGIAVSASRPGSIVVRNLTMKGGYRPWEANPNVYPRRTLFYPAEDWSVGSVKAKWQKAVLARFDGSHVHTENVSIEKFYYGVAAEDSATAFAYRTSVDSAGDAAFLAYTGGQLQAFKSAATNAADEGRLLGFGFVSESLRSLGKDSSFEFCAAQVVDQLEPFKTPNFWGCVVWMSYLIPTQSRSLLTATDCVARDNFIGGFLANSGAVMETTRSLAHGHFTRFKTAPGEIEGQSTHVLDDARPDRPNVYPYDWTGRGFGFMARHASMMTASDGVAFNNWIGFQAMFDASLFAPRARAYNNPHYGFHAVRKGRINAAASYAFGPYQKYGFAVDPTDSMIDVTDTLTINDFRSIPPLCFWGQTAPCLNWVVPQRQTVDFNVPIFQSVTPGNLGIFWR